MHSIFSRRPERKPGGTGRATPEDVRYITEEEWGDIAARRQDMRQPKTLPQIREALIQKNPWRFGELERQAKYFRKQMVKMGLNPEDLRWLI